MEPDRKSNQYRFLREEWDLEYGRVLVRHTWVNGDSSHYLLVGKGKEHRLAPEVFECIYEMERDRRSLELARKEMEEDDKWQNAEKKEQGNL